MKPVHLTRETLKQLARYKWVLFAAVLLGGIAGFIGARKTPALFTARASLFPLTGNNENNLSGSALSGLLGLTDPSKGFS